MELQHKWPNGQTSKMKEQQSFNNMSLSKYFSEDLPYSPSKFKLIHRQIYFLSLSLSLSLSLPNTHTHTHKTQSFSLSISFSFSFSLSHTHTHTLSVPLSLSCHVNITHCPFDFCLFVCFCFYIWLVKRCLSKKNRLNCHLIDHHSLSF